LFETVGIPCGPINSIDQVFADPQVKHLGIATPVQHPRLGELPLVASALNMSGVSKAIRNPTPDAGADTVAVLTEAGLTAQDIAQLRTEGAI
jgi:formyl-CoA transferase